LNTDGTFQYLPPCAKKVLGYELEELIGENPFDYVQSNDRERITAAFERMVKNPAY
jgi:PAS domain S-box-containing protein